MKSKRDYVNILREYAAVRGGELLSFDMSAIEDCADFFCAKGHKFSLRVSKVLYRKFWCNKCSKEKIGNSLKVPYENIKKFITGKQGELLTAADEYKNGRQKITIKCLKCNYIWRLTPNNMVHKDRWCPSCVKQIRTNTEIILKHINDKHGELQNIEDINKTPLNNRVELVIKCHKGHTWNTKFYNIRIGSWCPFCRKKQTSKGQLQLRDVLRNIYPNSKIFIDYNEFSWLKNKKTKQKQHIDIFLQDIDEGSTIAVEYDGEQHFRPVKHWGGIKTLKRIKQRDKLKNTKIKNHHEDVNYFVRITYKEILTEDNIKNVLRSHKIPFKE